MVRPIFGCHSKLLLSDKILKVAKTYGPTADFTAVEPVVVSVRLLAYYFLGFILNW